MIRRFIRFVFRLVVLSAIGLALFKVLKGRRSATEFGTPSADWAPPPAPNPNLPKAPPEPELVEPVMFEELIEKRAAVRAVPDPVPAPEPGSAPEPVPTTEVAGSGPTGLPRKSAVKKAPAKRAPAKKSAVPPAPPAAAGPVKKVVPKKVVPKKVVPKKAAAKKVAPPAEASPAAAPVAKKATPAKKAAKKRQ